MNITLNINEKKLEELILVLYCGNYVLTSIDPDSGEHLPVYNKLLDQLLQQSEEWRYNEGVTITKGGRYKLTELKELELHEYVEFYDNKQFWSTLSEVLAERDIREQMGEDYLSSTSVDDELYAEIDRMDQYDAEFEENGIANLHIVKEDWE